MKVRVINDFIDVTTDQLREVNDMLDVDAKRADMLVRKGLVEKVKEKETPKPKTMKESE